MLKCHVERTGHNKWRSLRRPEELIENGMAWEVGLSCGGQISILITPLALGSGWLDEWLRVRSAYEPRVVVTHLGTGRQELLGGGLHGLSRPQSPIEVIAKRACDEGRCLRETTHEGDFFFHPFLDRLRTRL